MGKEQKKTSLAGADIEDTIRQLQDRFGEGAIMRLTPGKRTAIEAVPTGSLALDIALGIGGIPRGRVIEIFGPEAGGKTTLTLHIIREAQKRGGLCAFIDAEHALDPDYAGRIGVQVKDLLVSQPDTGEQALEIVESLVRSGKVDVIVVDSVAALTPRAEIEGEMGDVHMGLQARLMSQALRKLTAITAKSKTSVIFINQVRMRIGVFFGNPETTPGGKALKFYSSVRIEVRRAAQIKKGDEIIGNRVVAKVVKNKVAPPFRNAEFDILYKEGISYETDVITLGEKYGVIKRLGSSFSYGDVKIGRGFDNARAFLKENAKVTNAIIADIKKAAFAPTS